MVKWKIFAGALLAGLLGLAGSVLAEPLPQPQGKVILTISGKITRANAGGEARFDREMLETLGMQTVTSKTPWYSDAVTFEGVPLAKLLEMVGAQGTTISATALNDYTTSIPIEDFTRFQTILALKLDGQYMTVRDKGPLFIVYPYDSDPELQNQTYYSRSIWQLAKLTVE